MKATYDFLQGVKVKLQRDPDARSLRKGFEKIRSWRTKVTRVLIRLKARLARLRGDLIRVERMIEHNASYIMATKEGLAGCQNVEQRKARIKLILEEWYEARALLRDEVQLMEEAVSSASIIRDELRYAYEEVSRSLTSLQFEYKTETGA